MPEEQLAFVTSIIGFVSSSMGLITALINRRVNKKITAMATPPGCGTHLMTIIRYIVASVLVLGGGYFIWFSFFPNDLPPEEVISEGMGFVVIGILYGLFWGLIAAWSNARKQKKAMA